MKMQPIRATSSQDNAKWHLAERPKEHPPIVVVEHDGLPAITASEDTSFLRRSMIGRLFTHQLIEVFFKVGVTVRVFVIGAIISPWV